MLTRRKTCCGSSSFSQPFRVNGCNSLALSGATVSVWTDSGKTTLLDSGDTDGSGDVTLDVGSSGSYYHEVSHTSSRFAVNSGTTTHNGTLKTISLTPATDYYCIANCLYPLYKTLHGTSAKIGSFTLTYAGGSWTGNVSWTSANCSCPSSTVSLNLTLVPVGSPLTTQLLINWNNNVNNCPDAAGSTVGFASGFSSSACPPSFSHSSTFSVTGTCTPRNLAAKGAFGIGSWSTTITE